MRVTLIGSILFAVSGALVAVGILHAANMPAWTPYVWPTWWWLMSASGHEQEPGVTMVIFLAIFSNAFIYATVGAALFAFANLLRRIA